MPDLSIVIPVFNEDASLVQLHEEIVAIEAKLNLVFELIFVDDGSTDQSWQVMKQLAADHTDVTSIRFRRNFGKASALRAGAAEATAPLVMTMDADLQDDPAEIPRFLEAMQGDYDLISGWKAVRHDPLGKTLPSKVFNWMVGFLTGVKLHDHNCGFKLYRREIFDEVKLYGEMHRFVPVLATARGYRVNEIPVHHRPRQHGTSKYGLERLLKGFLDLLTVSFLVGYNQRPQHVIGALGLSSCLAGSIGLIYLAIYWVLRMTVEAYASWPPVHQRPLLIISLGGLLLGAQLLCMGFLAELVVSRHQESKEPYSIREKLD